jgi:hypothetical protein
MNCSLDSTTTATIVPLLGKLPAPLCEAIAGGQPIGLVDGAGKPVAVVLDLESYAELEEALAGQQRRRA